MASAVEQFLTNVNQAGSDVQQFADALAQKIQQGGDIAVRAGHATTGAAVGAQAGSQVPSKVSIPPVVLYGGLALLAYKLLK